MKRIILHDMSDEFTRRCQNMHYWFCYGTVNSLCEEMEPNDKITSVISCYEARRHYYKVSINRNEVLSVKLIFNDKEVFERAEVKSLVEEITGRDDFIEAVNNAYKDKIDGYEKKIAEYNTEFQSQFGMNMEQAKEIARLYNRCEYDVVHYIEKKNEI